MIHIATVHWKDPKWIEPQQQALRSHLRSEYLVYANLEGINGHEEGFHYVNREAGPHAEKLNSLGRVITQEAASEDLLVFLDGDAFPIRHLDDWLARLLENHSLAAVRRAENRGDLQPHPCFCITTVGFWAEIQGDWREGTWRNGYGEDVSDVGGRLLGILNDEGHAWREILRSNTRDLHPVLYGLYEGHVYHHGAGFRSQVMTRADTAFSRTREYRTVRGAPLKTLLKVRPRHIKTILLAARQISEGIKQRPLLEAMRRDSDSLFEQICTNPDFWKEFEVDQGLAKSS